MAKETEIKVKVSTDALDELEKVAQATGMSAAAAVRQAIGIEPILADAKSKGAKIYIEYPDHTIKEMIF